MKSLIALILITILPTFNAHAETGDTYLGLGYHFPAFNRSGIKIKAGKYIAYGVSIEGHLLSAPRSDSATYQGDDIDLKSRQAISVFVRGDVQLSPTVNLYPLLGFSKGKLVASVLGPTLSEDDSGFSHGIGLEVKISNDTYISVEHIVYLSKSVDYDYADYAGFNIGITKAF